jgi:hypothetical protein
MTWRWSGSYYRHCFIATSLISKLPYKLRGYRMQKTRTSRAAILLDLYQIGWHSITGPSCVLPVAAYCSAKVGE